MMKKVLDYTQEYRLIENGDHVVVGVSGGADSVCLLFVLKELSKHIDFTMSVVHVNHHLRADESVRDERFVKALCQRLCIPCEVYEYKVEQLSKAWGMSIEETGRAVRQEAFALHASNVCERNNEQTGDWQNEVYAEAFPNIMLQELDENIKIALAHHQNDVAETFLYHLARGTDLKGLCAIRPRRGRYIRPLLCMNRKEIEHYLKEHNIEYVTDSTNEEDLYTRNKIRHHVVPYLEAFINTQAVGHMADTAESLSEVEDYLQTLYQEKYDQYVQVQEGGCLLHQGLWKEKPFLVKGVIRLVLGQLAGSFKNIGRVHILSVYRVLELEVGKCVSLPYKMHAQRGYQGISVWSSIYDKENLSKMDRQKKTKDPKVKEKDDTSDPLEALLLVPGETVFGDYLISTVLEEETLKKIPEKTYTKWFDYDKIEGNLVLRYRKSGDYLVMNAKGGRKKIKNYFIDEKIPQKERDKIPLLCCGDHVAWVCGHRISELYKVDDSTKRILRIQISAIHRDLKNIKGE